MENVIGIWKPTWHNQGVESPLKRLELKDIGKYKNSEEIVDYLNAGHRIIAKRSILFSNLTGNIIGVPEILYDGAFIWSSEYTYYVKIGFLQVDEALFAHAKRNKFLITPASNIDLKALNKLLQKIGFPTVASLG